MACSSPGKGVLSAPINKETLDAFRIKCKQLNVPMSTVVEVFCKEFVKGKFEFTFARSASVELVDKQVTKSTGE